MVIQTNNRGTKKFTQRWEYDYFLSSVVNKMCIFIKDLICSKKESEIKNFNIIYGGSVNPKNAVQLFASNSLDGVLIGRASINFDEFLRICSVAESS